MELKYILNKSVIAAFIIILLSDILLFCKGLNDRELACVDENGYEYSDFVFYYNDCIDFLRDADNSELTDKINLYYRENVTDENKKSLLAAVKQLKEQADYVNSYASDIEESVRQAETMISFNIYNDKSSYSYNNILKGRYDLKKLKDIDLKVTSNIAYDNIFGYKYAGYFIALIMIIFVSRFKADNLGFDTIIKASCKGRGRLAAKRAGLTAAVGIMAALFIYMPIVLISFARYGGIGDINCLIQCNSLFSRSVLIMSYGELLAVVIALHCAAAAAAGFVAWLFFLIFRDRHIAVMGIVIFSLLEGIFYLTKSGNMFFKFMRSVNIFTFLNPSDIFKKYDNWGFGQYIINTGFLSIIAIIFIILTSLIIILCISSSLWCGIEVKSKGLSRAAEKIRKRFAYLPDFIKELKKTLLIQKGLLVIAVVLLYIITADFGVAGTAENGQLEMAEYYSYAQGDAYQKTDEYIKDTVKWIDEAQKTAEQLEKNGDITGSNDILNRIKEKENMLNRVSEESERVKQLNNRGIVSAGVLDTYKYEKRYGARMNTYYQNFVLAGFFVVIFLTCKTFSIERKSKMASIIRTTDLGRGKYLRTRILTGIFVVEAVVLTENIIQFIKVNNVFSLKDYERTLAVQSVSCMENCPLGLSIIQFEIVLIIYRMAVYGLTALLIIGLSMYLEESGVFFVSIIAFLPYILSSIGIKNMDKYSIVRITSGVECFQSSEGVLNIIIFISVLSVVAAVSVRMAVVKWRRQ